MAKKKTNGGSTKTKTNGTKPPVQRRPQFVDGYVDSGEVPHDLLEQEGPFDIVVGINAKDVETTIVHVLNVVCTGLQQHFPALKPLVVVVDGNSKDQTVRLARFYPTPNGIRKLVMKQAFGPGKGNGVRSILEISQAVDAHATVCVDGDLVSIQPNWIDTMIRPILYGLTDMVAPYYLRDKWDGVITNHLCYPLTAALYGTSVRQPIGGDYSFSSKMVKHLLKADDMPPHFGIDIYLATTAIAEGLRIQEAPLGIKVHSSTAGYTDPKKVLSRMYLEVVGTLLDLASKYEAAWKRQDTRAPVLLSENVIPYYDRLPPETTINEDSMRAIYHEGVKERTEILQDILPEDLYKEITEDCKDGLPMEAWAKAVYAVAAFHIAAKQGGGAPEDHLHALGALGMGRFLKFVDETRDLALKEAFELVKKQATLFSRMRPEFAELVAHYKEKAQVTSPAS